MQEMPSHTEENPEAEAAGLAGERKLATTPTCTTCWHMQFQGLRPRFAMTQRLSLPITRSDMTKLLPSLRRFFLLAAFALPAFLMAQQNDQIEWSDDEEETEAAAPGEEPRRPKADKAEVKLNGELYEVGSTATFQRGDSIDLSVRDLAPNSWVAVQMKKGGIVLNRKGFFANERGELDLLIYTGEKKVKGSATVIYTSSGGKKVEQDCEIAIE
jgi:hypothetical protein